MPLRRVSVEDRGVFIDRLQHALVVTRVHSHAVQVPGIEALEVRDIGIGGERP